MHAHTRSAACAAAFAAVALLTGCQQSSGPTAPPTDPVSAPPPSTASPAGQAAPSGTDPAPYRTRTGELGFRTPWGASCGMLPRNTVTPNTPTAGCWEITGKQQVLTVSPTSKAAVKQVQQGFFAPLRGPALPAGSTLELDGVRCVQSAADLTCTAGAHGFTLRPDGSLDLH